MPRVGGAEAPRRNLCRRPPGRGTARGRHPPPKSASRPPTWGSFLGGGMPGGWGVRGAGGRRGEGGAVAGGRIRRGAEAPFTPYMARHTPRAGRTPARW